MTMFSRCCRSRRCSPNDFPSQQLTVLALCRICEPIAFMSIFPYIYYMVSSFHITSDEKQIAFYAGLVTSAFAFAEFSTGVIWGRLSDRIGRKPILLTGLAGTGISMLVFGFAPNLTTALIARALGGLLNGNMGVLQTTVAEVVTVEAHQARAYSIMPFVWCLGSIIGSGLGGTLADPVNNYPEYFSRGTIWEKFPYLLPNLVCASVVVVGLVVGILFLEETHEDKKKRRDVGLEAGRRIMRLFGYGEYHDDKMKHVKGGMMEEVLTLIGEQDTASAYGSTASSPILPPTYNRLDSPPPLYSEGEPRTSISSAISMLEIDDDANDQQAVAAKMNSAVAGAFTKQVLFNIVGYGILAYHTISAEQLLPVLFSMPETDSAPQLPFKFVGGFALSTKSIGFILSIQGFLQMFMTIFVFPFVNRKFGSLVTFRIVILSYPLLYLLLPYMTLLPKSLRMPAIYFVLIWKVTGQALSYPSSAIMLANSAPSRRVLGTLNGVAASAASLCRTFGPTVSGLLQSTGLSLGFLGVPWWANAGVALTGAILSLCMREEVRREFADDKKDDEDRAGSLAVDELNAALVARGRSERRNSSLITT